MSRTHHSHHTKHKLSEQRNKAETTAVVTELNETIERLVESVLPKQPYLLSIPSDVPYRHAPSFVQSWYIGTPFGRREEQVQYLSLLPHQEEDETLLRVIGGWSDDRGNHLDDNPFPRTVDISGANTPSVSSSRKKISLKDYQSKDKPAGEVEHDSRPLITLAKENPRSSDAREMRKPQLQKELSHYSVQFEAETVAQTSIVTDKAHNLDRMERSSASNLHRGRENGDRSPRSNKRRKLTPPTDNDGNSKSVRVPEKARAASPKKFPKLLSPTLPASGRENGLPQLLSPLLPPSLIEAMATPPQNTLDETGNGHRRSDSVRSILADALEGTATPTNPAAGGRVRSASQHSIKSNNSALRTGVLAAKSIPAKTALTADNPPLSTSQSPGPRQRRKITLKYGKKNRKRVEALLKFAARPKKTVPRSEIPPDRDVVTEARPKLPAEDTKPLEKKRVREESPERIPKKPEPSALLSKRPTTTPNRPQATENSVTNTPPVGVSKPAVSTPRKDLKSTAMRRVESADGGYPHTPGGKARGTTPLSVDRPLISKTSPRPTSAPIPRDEERQAWMKLGPQYFELGRTIKHEGTQLQGKSEDPARAAILLVEALLCFMINNATLAYCRPNVPHDWPTILPYHDYVHGACKNYPHLEGLVVQLGAVCRQIIHKHDMDRLLREPLPEEHSGSAPTPGSDGSTKTGEDIERYKKRYLDFKNDLVTNARELQQAWLDGSRLLSADTLEKHYAKTWMRRAKNTSGRGSEKFTSSSIPREFYLPVDATTTAFEAVRFGMAMLKEWAGIQGVDWRTRITI